jgi:glutamate synthase (NADPH/NADH) small chain
MAKKQIIPKKTPMPEQLPEIRIHNYNEVPFGYTEQQAIAEASRCLECAKPSCMKGCPVNITSPAF